MDGALGIGHWALVILFVPLVPLIPLLPISPTPYSLLPTPKMHPLRAGTLNVNC